MRYSINLDTDPLRGAVKIENKVTDGMLLAEFHAHWLSAQLVPKQDFGQGHLLAKSPGCMKALRAVIFQLIAPTVSALRCHLPQRGRIWIGTKAAA